MSKTTIKALRYYDETGLLKPEETDPFTGYRLYTTDQLVQVHRIQALRQTGLTVEETRRILSGQDAQEILEQRRVELQNQLSETKHQLSRLDFMLQGKEEEFMMNYAATIKRLDECTVYSTKFTAADYDAFFEVIPAIGAKVTEKYPDLKCAIPEYCFVRYLDGEYREKEFRVEFCEAVDQMKQDFDDITFKRMEPETVVSVMHRGPYSTLGDAYAFAMKWAEQNHYPVTGLPRENHIDGIWNKEREEDWLTEIQIPVAAK